VRCGLSGCAYIKWPTCPSSSIVFGYGVVIAAAPAIGIPVAVLIHIGVMCWAASKKKRDPRAPRQ
jgi:hypothetical protein